MAGFTFDSSDNLYIVALSIAIVAVTSLVYLSRNVQRVIFGNDLVTLQPRNKDGTVSTVHLSLVEKEILSHDTRRFRFALPSIKHTLGLPVGQHITLRYTDSDGKVVMRSYTPVSLEDTLGYVDLVIKVYFKNVHPKFPEGGKMSQHLESLKIGDTIEVSGPKGKLTYAGKGQIQIKHRLNDSKLQIRWAKKIGMIAGGTGITPMLQILRHALRNSSDRTEFFLLFANQTEQDILLRDEIDSFEKQNDNVHVWYTIDRNPSADWKYSVGFVTKELIQEYLPSPASDVQILICGPPPMVKFAVQPALDQLGFEQSMSFSF